MKLPETIGVTRDPANAQGVALTNTGWIPARAKYQGQELSYVEFTSDVAVTATTEATASTVVTSDSIECDGSPIFIEFYTCQVTKGTNTITVCLYEDTGSIGQLANASANQAGGTYARRRTPSIGRHTYSIRAFVDAGLTGTVQAGAGGSGNQMPGFIRITRAAGGNT